MGEHAGVAALMKGEVPHVLGVHAVAHVLELGWLDAVKDVTLIEEMLAINQEAYVHYAQSGKKRLTFEACCDALGEDSAALISMHGIRWRESGHRAAINLLKTWRARTTDLLEEASTEVGMDLTPLSAPELFLKRKFRKRTPDEHGVVKTYTLSVTKYIGMEGGAEMFVATYLTRTKWTEKFSKGDLLGYLLDDSDKLERLYATSAGKLYAKMTKFSYVKMLHAWADLCSEGKVLSKLLQRNGVLISDVTTGVEDCIAAVGKLAAPSSPGGVWMKAFASDYDSGEERLDGISLSDVVAGEKAYVETIKEVGTSIIDHLNARFTSWLGDPILKAACIFEHSRWPSFETARERLEAHGDGDISKLLTHFSVLLRRLGCDCDRVEREWTRLKSFVMRDENLRALKYHELYERLFDQFSDKANSQHFYNVLLIAAIVQTIAVDTSICERGFSLMNNLKTAKRSSMGTVLLRMLMTICTLGANWEDPTKIPVAEIMEEWRAQAKRGRYESKMWTPEALEVEGDTPSNSAAAPDTAASAAGDRPAVLGEFWDLTDLE